MRFIYILIVSFLLSSSLWGQKTFASRAMDYQWLYKSFIWTNVSGHYTGYIDTTDNTYNGKDYRLFKAEGFNFQIADSGTRVFALAGAKEYLLMDYSLNIRDTLISYFATNPYKLRVIAKSKVKIENDSLWRMELKSVAHPTNVPALIWIESIGCLNTFHPINWPRMFSAADLGYNLDCVIHSDTSILRIFNKNCAIDNSLSNSNKIWHTWASNHNGDLKFSVPYYFTNRDTVLFGKNYWIMNQKNRYVRYDSIEGKYFVLYNPSNGIEQLVYCDRVKVGDTMSTPYNQADTVVKIEYKWMDDDYRKVITTGRDIYLSGIGSVNRVMWDNHLVTFPEYQAGNICFEENGTIKYHYTFFYQNNEQCDITSSIVTIQSNGIELYYSNQQLHIVSDYGTTQKLNLKIYDLVGRLQVEERLLLFYKQSVPIGVIAEGIYFAELDINGQRIYLKFQK